jgi:hypothetical protein
MATIDYEWTMARMRKDTLEKLQRLKLVDGETYDEVINRLISLAEKSSKFITADKLAKKEEE